MVKRKSPRRKLMRKSIPEEKKKKKKTGPPEEKMAIIVGKAYTIEDIQKLISSLTNVEAYVQVRAIAEFAENQAAISDAAAKAPDISGTDITEKVIEAAKRNEDEMLKRFEEEKRINALNFLADSSSVPPKIAERAEKILEKMPAEEHREPEIKKEVEAPSLEKKPYSPKQVKALISNMESTVKEIRVASAIKFFKDYAKLTPTIAKMPLLTVTAVTQKAVKIITKMPDDVLNRMFRKKMLPELVFLASLSQIPMSIRKSAMELVNKLKAELPSAAALRPIPFKEEPKEPERPAAAAEKKPAPPKKEKKAAPPQKEAPTPKTLTVWEIKAMMRGLDLSSARAVLEAMKFLKNYDQVVKVVSKEPMLSVTEVTQKAVKVVEKNLPAILKKLKKAKDVRTLKFLAESSKFSTKTRKRAGSVLKMLQKPPDKEKKRAMEELLPPFEDEEE